MTDRKIDDIIFASLKLYKCKQCVPAQTDTYEQQNKSKNKGKASEGSKNKRKNNTIKWLR